MSSVLDQLRMDAEKAAERFDFFFDFRGTKNQVNKANSDELGGACTFTAGEVSKTGIVVVGVENNGSDYFFPWVPRGVGAVSVPISSPDGTIVATGQLNGCTVEVIQSGSKLWFYHDGDGEYLRKTVQPVAGTTLCVVEPKDYAPNDLGTTLMKITQKHASVTNDVTKNRAYCYQIYIVKNGDKWKLFSSGLLLFNGSPTDGFRDSQSKLLATFSPVATPTEIPVRPRAATI